MSLGASLYTPPLEVADSALSLAVAIAYTGNGTLYGATLCVLSSTHTIVNDPDVCFGTPRPSTAPWHLLQTSAEPLHLRFPRGTRLPLAAYVGAEARVAVAGTHTGRAVVLVASSHGWCPNNEPDNKRADLGVCDVPPLRGGTTSSPDYLTYHTADIAAWGLQLLGADVVHWRDTRTGSASPCSTLVATGMWGMGRAPAPVLVTLAAPQRGADRNPLSPGWAAVLPSKVNSAIERAATMIPVEQSRQTRQASSELSVMAWVVFDGMTASTSDPASCGGPVAAPEALMLASWPLPFDFVDLF